MQVLQEFSRNVRLMFVPPVAAGVCGTTLPLSYAASEKFSDGVSFLEQSPWNCQHFAPGL